MRHWTGPTYCWHCGKQLQFPHFAEFTDRIGNVHRVHKQCLPLAKASQ